VPDPADVSPLRSRPLAGLPPAVVVSGGCDPVRDEARAYAEALAAAGVRVLDLRADTLVHGFYWLADSVEPAARALREIGGYVREVFATAVSAP
jgi:acetyl esterase